MNIDSITAELLAEPLDQFTSRRNARAKELKASGAVDLAKEVVALKKPPIHVWAANRSAREEPAALRRVVESAREVAKAQTGGKALRELRAASEGFQKNLEAAGNAAGAVLKSGGHAGNEETLRRIRDIFREAVMQGGD